MELFLSILGYSLGPLPVWSWALLSLATLFIPRVRKAAFQRVETWAMSLLNKGGKGSTGTGTGTGKMGMVLFMAISLVGATPAMILLNGCGGGLDTAPYPQQIVEQGGTALDINKATYYQAVEVLKVTNDRVADQIELLPESAKDDPAVRKWVKEVNKALDDASDTLKDWKLAIEAFDVVDADASAEQWRELRNKLIQKAVLVIIEK